MKDQLHENAVLSVPKEQTVPKMLSIFNFSVNLKLFQNNIFLKAAYITINAQGPAASSSVPLSGTKETGASGGRMGPQRSEVTDKAAWRKGLDEHSSTINSLIIDTTRVHLVINSLDILNKPCPQEHS